MRKLETLQATLPLIKSLDMVKDAQGKFELVEVQVKPYSFINDGYLYISMEEGDDIGCFYGRYIDEDVQDGIPYVDDILEAWAIKNKGYWEWQDAGTIVFIN